MKPTKRVLAISLLFLFNLVGFSTYADEPVEPNKSGFYIDIGPTVVAPFAGNKFTTTFISPTGATIDLDPGFGFLLGLGYNFELISIGLQLDTAFLDKEVTFPPGSAINYTSDGEDLSMGLGLASRLYFLEIFGDPQSFFRPYAHVGGGLAWLVADDVAVGYDVKTGVGIEWELLRHLILGTQVGYRFFDLEEVCDPAWSGGCVNPQIHAFDANVRLSIRF